MRRLFEKAWLNGALCDRVAIEVDDAGTIKKVARNAAGDVTDSLLLPGFPNNHSHAFQYGMVGETEFSEKNTDDFWSWREKMYSLALKINPDQMFAIAAQLYAEMLRFGITHVTEFHYLHRDPSGVAYNNLAETSETLVAAARHVGMKIVIVPVYYRTANFGKTANENQRRFAFRDVDEYLKLVELLRTKFSEAADVTVGCGIHSLRAASEGDLSAIVAGTGAEQPFHIHVAEQTKEVDDCLEFYGRRPVAWLAEKLEFSESVNLVHATHLDQSEIELIAGSQANVVLCPSTEANLGDGVFPLAEYFQKQGIWTIGTDSHVCLNPFEDLRLLDYGQRLVHRKRNLLSNSQQGRTAAIHFQTAVETGYRAMKQKVPLSEGASFDGVVVDLDHPSLVGKEDLLGAMFCSADSRLFRETIVSGRTVVKDTVHLASEEISRQYQQAIGALT